MATAAQRTKRVLPGSGESVGEGRPIRIVEAGLAQALGIMLDYLVGKVPNFGFIIMALSKVGV